MLSKTFKIALGITLSLIIGTSVLITVLAVRDCQQTHSESVGDLLDRIEWV